MPLYADADGRHAISADVIKNTGQRRMIRFLLPSEPFEKVILPCSVGGGLWAELLVR
jgi:hypothetical protein